MEEQDLSGILVSGETRDVVIEHGGQEYSFTVKPLSWRAKNRILSRSISSDGTVMKVDMDSYFSLVLKEIIIKAPWPLTQTSLFLDKLDDSFGKKLQDLIPSPYGEELDDEQKKESEEL